MAGAPRGPFPRSELWDPEADASGMRTVPLMHPQSAPRGGAAEQPVGARSSPHLPVKGVHAGRPLRYVRSGELGGGGSASSGSTPAPGSHLPAKAGEERKGFPDAEAPLLSVLHPGTFMQQIIWEENESRA